MQKSYKRRQLTPGNAAVDQKILSNWRCRKVGGGGTARKARDQRRSRRLLGAPSRCHAAARSADKAGPRQPHESARAEEPRGEAGGGNRAGRPAAARSTLELDLLRPRGARPGAPGARGAPQEDAPAAARRAAGTIGRAGSGRPPAPLPQAPRPSREPAGPRRRAGANRLRGSRANNPRRRLGPRGASQGSVGLDGGAGDRGAGALIATVAPMLFDFFCPPGSKHPRFNCLRLTCGCGGFLRLQGGRPSTLCARASCGDSCASFGPADRTI